MNNDREKMLGTMNVKKLLMKLSIPAMMGMLINALYNIVDTFFVARGAGEDAIGGLAFAFPVQMILMAVGLMIGVGSASVYSRAFGKKDYKTMDLMVNSAIKTDIIIAVIFAVLGYIFLTPLLSFFGATSSNFQYGIDYLSIILIGLVPMTLSMVLNNLTRAEGRAVVSMYALMIGAGLNIILDPIFIFAFGMGVKGAAIATVIAQFSSFIFIFFQAYGKKSNLNVHFNHFFTLDFKLVWESLSVGFPTFLRNATGAIITIIIFRLIAQYAGSDDLITTYQSIYGVINRVINFVFLPSFGIVQGLVPIVSFNFGAKNYQRLKDVIKFATTIVIIYFILGFIFIYFVSPYIFVAFSESNDANFINLGAQAFRLLSFGFTLVGFQIVASSIFQSFGYPLRAMVVTISRQVLFFIPLVYIFSSLWGMVGIWIAFGAADFLTGFLSIFLLNSEMRTIHRYTLEV
ncbi:MAG: MATE family efflux transporter [Acholeplasmataceae bacterium]